MASASHLVTAFAVPLAVLVLLALGLWAINFRLKLLWREPVLRAIEAGDLDKALELLRQVRATRPTAGLIKEAREFWLQRLMGIVRLRRKETAIAALSLEAAAKSQFATDAQKEELLILAMHTYRHEKNYKKVIELWQLMPKQDACEPLTYNMVALAYSHLGEYRLAAETIGKIIDPKVSDPTFLTLQSAWYHKAGNYLASLDVMKRLAAACPENPTYAKLSKLSPQQYEHVMLQVKCNAQER